MKNDTWTNFFGNWASRISNCWFIDSENYVTWTKYNTAEQYLT